jgi:glycosyltransferase involved in cell wall biosynthesis
LNSSDQGLVPSFQPHGLWESAAFRPDAAAGAPSVGTLYINGKFAAQRTTGVQRVARNLLIGLDEYLGTNPSCLPGRVVLLLPHGAQAPALRRIESRQLGANGLRLSIWEQRELPQAARTGVLMNLSGSAPLLARRQVCLLHDAAVFDRPQAYAAAFRYWYRFLFRSLARRDARLLTVSAFSRQRLAAQLGIPASVIGLVPGGGEHLSAIAPDPAALARHGLESGRYLLAVGSANVNKNFDLLQAAFSTLPASCGAKLVIVGRADARVFAGWPARTAADAGFVVRAGAVDDATLKALYQHAAGLVFPSLYEGFGLPPLEAMSCACPVAASSAAAIPEVCGDAVLYFDPNSVDQMAGAMQRLLDDVALRDRLRRAGAERVARFSWHAAARALVGHLQTALAADRVRA